MSELCGSKLTAALVVSATAGLSLAPILLAHVADEPKQQVSSADYAMHLQAAKDDELRAEYREALVEIEKARELPNPTLYDTHLINELAAYAYYKTNHLVDAAKAKEALINDGLTDPNEANHQVKDLATIYYRLKDYGKAIDYANRAIKAGVADQTTRLVVAQSYYLKNDYQNAVSFTDSWIAQSIKDGETPKEQTLKLNLSACVQMKDALHTTTPSECRVAQACVDARVQDLTPSRILPDQNWSCETRILERLMTYYPQPKYAELLLYIATMNRKPCEAARLLNEVVASKLLTYPSQKDTAQRNLDAATRFCAR